MGNFQIHPLSIVIIFDIVSRFGLAMAGLHWKQRSSASERKLKPRRIKFLSSFIRIVLREDQFPLLDLRHLSI
jgi:hypothetical protein